MVAINLNAAGVIQFEAARDAFRLYPAVGGAQIELTMRAWRADERKESLPCTVVATMSVGRHPNVGQRPVCDLRYAHIFSPTTQGNQVQLKGFITDHQLRVIEEIRNGVALWVNLELAVTCLDGDPRQLLESWGNEPISIQSGEWAEALERVDTGSYVELLVPLPANKQHANAVRRLRNARDLVRDNKIEEALGESRKAMEKVRKAYQTGKVAAAAAKKDARQHSKEERWALYVESIFSLAQRCSSRRSGHYGELRLDASGGWRTYHQRCRATRPSGRRRAQPCAVGTERIARIVGKTVITAGR